MLHFIQLILIYNEEIFACPNYVFIVQLSGISSDTLLMQIEFQVPPDKDGVRISPKQHLLP